MKIFGGKRPIGHFGLVSISVGFLLGAASLIATSGCGESSTSQGRDLDPGKGATAARKIESSELSENLNFARLLGRQHFAFVVVDVPSIINDPQTKDVPWDQFFQSADEYLGEKIFDIDQLSRLVWLMDTGMTEFDSMEVGETETRRRSSPGMVSLFEAKTSFDEKSIAEKLERSQSLSKLGNGDNSDELTQQLWGNENDKIGILLLDSRYVLVGDLASLRKMVASKRQNPQLQQAAMEMDMSKQINGAMILNPIRPFLKRTFGLANQLAGQMIPEEERKIFAIPTVTDKATFSMDLSDDTLSEIRIVMDTEKSASDLCGYVQQAITTFTGVSAGNPGVDMPNLEMMFTPESSQFGVKLMKEMGEGGMVVGLNKKTIEVTIRQSETTRQFVRALVVDSNRQANLVRRTQALKEIGDAFKTFHVEYNAYPGSKGAGPETKLGWRVQLLPLLGQQELYDQFRHDEPWDSEHNLALAKKMPQQFEPFANGNKVSVHIPGGKGLFAVDASISNAQIQDDIGETVLCFEGNPSTAIEWTRPDVFEVDEDVLSQLGRENENGVLILVAEGDVRIYKKSLRKKALGLFTPAGGENFRRSDFIRQ